MNLQVCLGEGARVVRVKGVGDEGLGGFVVCQGSRRGLKISDSNDHSAVFQGSENPTPKPSCKHHFAPHLEP